MGQPVAEEHPRCKFADGLEIVTRDVQAAAAWLVRHQHLTRYGRQRRNVFAPEFCTKKVVYLKENKKAVTSMTIGSLVKDWGGFEKLVAELHETGEVTVEHGAILAGRSAATRQIDVLIRHKQGLYEHLVVVECKYWNSPIERLHVDALATTVREVGASRGVIFRPRDTSPAQSPKRSTTISTYSWFVI